MKNTEKQLTCPKCCKLSRTLHVLDGNRYNEDGTTVWGWRCDCCGNVRDCKEGTLKAVR